MSKLSSPLLLFIALCALFLAACDTSAGNCNYANTYDAIQATIFEAKGCTASSCHGDAALGGLDLRPGASFDALVRQSSTIATSMKRVFPGDQDLSLLYHKLAAGTEGSLWYSRLRPWFGNQARSLRR